MKAQELIHARFDAVFDLIGDRLLDHDLGHYVCQGAPHVVEPQGLESQDFIGRTLSK